MKQDSYQNHCFALTFGKQQFSYTGRFVTLPIFTDSVSTKLEPIFLRQAYKKGRSPHSALMQRIEKKLGWQNEREKIGDLKRPDVDDYKIKDWCDITKAPDEKAGPYALG